MLSNEELEVLEKVLDYTLAREAAVPTGKRPLLADPTGLAADDMVVYLRMVECAERERDLRENGAALKADGLTGKRT
jgi:hypothetical protein